MNKKRESVKGNNSANRLEQRSRRSHSLTRIDFSSRTITSPVQHLRIASAISIFLLIVSLMVASCGDSNEADSAASSARFDMWEVSQYRPVFGTHYFGGFKGNTEDHLSVKNISTDVDGIDDWSRDFERIKLYLDPVINHVLFGFRTHYPRFEWPDLVKNDPAEIEQWKQGVRSQLAEIMQTYRENQLQMIPLTVFFLDMGTNTAPKWYEAVPDWSELTIDGKVPSGGWHPLGGEIKGLASLANPELYRVAERRAALLKELDLDKEEVFIAIQPENEPRMGRSEENLGGNRYTKDLFREFLKKEDGDIEGFNQAAGTNYGSFDEVDIGDDSPVIAAYATRFRAWLVGAYYQKKLGDISQEAFPEIKVLTRFQLRGMTNYMPEITTDYAGFSYYPSAYIDENGENIKDRMGELNYFGSMIEGYGKPLALTEFGIRKGIAPSTTLTESIRPYEVFNLMYRSLRYNVRFICFFWYTHPVLGTNWANLYGMHLSRFPDTLFALRQVRDEMERIRPYETFGRAYRGELAVLMSRNSLHYPGLGSPYSGTTRDGDIAGKLTRLWEDPRFSDYDLIEEHSPNLEELLSRYRGIVVVDACLNPQTRELLQELARKGTKILALGAPRYLDSRYRMASIPDSYPIDSILKASVEELRNGQDVRVRKTADHPLVNQVKQLRLIHSVPVKVKAGATGLLEGVGGTVAAARNDVAYISGLPAEISDWGQLLLNFSDWAGVSVKPIVVSQFENAIVVQNWRPEVEDLARQRVGEKDWIGRVAMKDGSWTGQLREMRRDMPWLAYTRNGDTIQVEGLRLATMEVQVIQKWEAKEAPHFEGTPEDVGFLEFTLGWDHVVGKLEVAKAGEKVLRYAAGMWGEKPVAWQVNVVNSPQIVAQGTGPEIRFRAQPGKQYYLTVRQTEGHNPACPVCSQGRMM